MRRFVVLPAVSALVLSSLSPAFAKDAPKQNSSDYMNEKVCQTMTVTGSRLGKKRVCATRAQWEAQRLQDRQEVERIQRSPCVIVSSAGNNNSCSN
jgi:hypothetical protein